ncbi:DUF3870 domain-containing protein [Dendrosporobacter sp. 1207_IL3150]|uniref:DUF3870 domain-containing protein n=1 Tax=Dendrosporobacter sp. 1207_IL3150 TaxID=3084054 RepID=UPI002FDA737D
MVDPNLVLFSGYAKLPTGITASELYKIIGVIVLVNMDTGKIVEADCTLATQLARKHVSAALVGHNLTDGPDQLSNLIDKIYQGNAKKAIITALRIIYDKYRSYNSENHPYLDMEKSYE